MFPNLDSLMKEAQELQGKMAQVQERLAIIRLVGQAGEGSIAITVNGLQEVQQVRIDPDAMDRYTLAQLEGLLKEATNQALAMSQAEAAKEMEKASGNLSPGKLLKNLPGLGK